MCSSDLLARPLVVQVRNALGQPRGTLDLNGNNTTTDPGEAVSVTFSTDKGTLTSGATSGASITVPVAANGLANAALTLRSGGGAGDLHTVTVTCGACTVTTPVVFTATATISGALTPRAGNDQKGVATQPLLRPLVVAARDAAGNPLTGLGVQFTTSAGTLSAPSAVTDANGEARVTLTLGAAGTHTITASYDFNRVAK